MRESGRNGAAYEHAPVLAGAVADGLRIRPDGVYADGTLGGGGHAALICGKLSAGGLLLGIDKDRDAIEAAGKTLSGYVCGRILRQGDFGDIKEILRENGVAAIDGALLDLGVSSYQLDNPERGFSYRNDAPLDMRMDARDEKALTAEQVVNTYDAGALTRVFREYGEERWASRIAAFIIRAREKEPVRTTGALTDIIKAAIPASARRTGPHPAKRCFQALRIEVNGELRILERAVGDFVDVLSPGGRLAVITFHSLEDRIVKDVFRGRETPCECPPDLPVCVCGKTPDARRVNRRPIIADETELAENHRARSAKLRIIEKL
ncbi:MAG: 16S rRNA (cytosine(1402)-N(4))-methyltransferase RsmH [Clostridiales Family XIII bacterium]|jgi:16S rRNA (cytosine1402-N4)-methyltransferase|nr:16S rRNA (cytosine(1402)-N(4))-methyltransferase RsmH [Clostridiales Family XIII bacterium]